MSILLPNIGSTTDDVVAELNKEAWQAWAASIQMHEGTIVMPRFELEYEETLNSVLAALGMEEAFDPTAADFSGINQEMVLYIDEVKHKSYVKVNEQGTEAAAVTSVGIKTVSAPQEFRVDRPFVFVIHDSHSQSLLFMGRIVDLPDA
jgi:serpin B